MLVNSDLFKTMRTGKRLLRAEYEYEYKNKVKSNYIGLLVAVLILLAVLFFMAGCACASEPNYSQYADVIYKVENSKSHPYGIMKKYKHTTPRTACINTMKHQYRNWVKAGSPGDYIKWLSYHYAPLNVSNDPFGLNRNWERNFRAILFKKGN